MDEGLLTTALRAYFHSLAVVEPIRFQFWDEKGLTNAQTRVLYALLSEGPLAVGQVAERLQVRPATATAVVDRLVKAKLVRRRVGRNDRRVVEVHLTPEGRLLFQQIAAAGRAYLGQVFSRMPEEDVRTLATLLEAFSNHASAVQREGEFQA
jgi:DNA-binding MarR family transcriptional regulator